jgi:hypothetical protein
VSPIRKRLPALAVAWLLAQVAALAAAPIVFGCVVEAKSGSELHECCRNLAPGQQCPMHHEPHDEERPAKPDDPGDCAVRSACAPTEAALLALAGMLGLPSAALSFVSRDAADLVSPEGSHAIIGATRPESPPPRPRL